MTPAVRRLVREHDIDIAQLSGSGAGGRVTRDDVLAFIDNAPAAQATAEPAPSAEPPAAAAPAPAAAPAEAAPAARPSPPSVPSPSGGDVELPLTQMRKGIAKKMTQVKQTVPHAYTVVEVDMTNVVKWREANNMAFKAREGASLSYVAVVIKAVTETLRKHPTLNSQFADDKIILKQAMNIGIAVAVDNGLIVPVIANADQLSISGVNARIREHQADVVFFVVYTFSILFGDFWVSGGGFQPCSGTDGSAGGGLPRGIPPSEMLRTRLPASRNSWPAVPAACVRPSR